MSLEFFRLFVNSFQYLISISVDIKVHFFIVVGTQFSWVAGELIINCIIDFYVSRFTRNDMNHQMLNRGFGWCILYMNCR
jgi:hypothetical protein